jgi:uncharacterized protein (DUF302 family)
LRVPTTARIGDEGADRSTRYTASIALRVLHQRKRMMNFRYFDSAPGIVTRASFFSMDETISLLQRSFSASGLRQFAMIDFDKGAALSGAPLPSTKLLMFGDPFTGIPLVLQNRAIAMDLPLKLLVWEDERGLVQVSIQEPAWMLARYGIPESFRTTFSGLAGHVDVALTPSLGHERGLE